MSIHLRGSETHGIELFITCGLTHSIKGLRVVHVDVKRVESPLGVVHDCRLLERALIVLVDVAGVVVLRDVKHLLSFLFT